MRQPVTGRADWMGTEATESEDWVHILSDLEVSEIDKVLRGCIADGVTIDVLTREQFPVPGLTGLIDDVRGGLEEGRGIFLIRGLPTAPYSKEELRLIYWGFGLHLGTAVSQSKRGDLLGDVRDLGTPLDGPKFRGYTSHGELTYHSDAADVTGLLCLRPAKSGGLSRIVSAPAVHNEILKTRPDLLEVLYQPFYWSFQGNEFPGTPTYYQQPVFTVHEGHFACRYTRTHMRSAHLMDDVPSWTPEQSEALDLIDTICERPEFQLTMMFQPGDMQFLNNHLAYHMRTEFEDYSDPDEKRHLLRLWLAMPNSRPLAPGFKAFYGDTRAGAVRGGHPGHGDTPAFTTI
ncbi:MAG: TauD/TfdA family dioxygenase [Rhodospirillales bacterium]|nr:TauD/TfdA family dioxygenase [Rhodospirillales bacterium]